MNRCPSHVPVGLIRYQPYSDAVSHDVHGMIHHIFQSFSKRIITKNKGGYYISSAREINQQMQVLSLRMTVHFMQNGSPSLL